MLQDVNTTRKAAQSSGSRDSGIRRYFVRIPVTICSNPSDLHERIDQLMLGNPDHASRGQCRSIPAGAVLLMELPGRRPTVEYRNFPIEQAMLPDGTAVWSDEFGSTHVQLINGTAKH